jgi:glycosyltransferase involved in cell wall biosynthesis
MYDGKIRAAIADRLRPSRSAAAAMIDGSWVHLCNGLDPRRDGGMVPSILGMTAALGRLRDPVTIVTPTPSRIEPERLAAGVRLRGPEIDLVESIRRAQVVHIHGLWQTQTCRGAPAARAARVPYLITAHGMAEPWALRQKYWKKRVYLALIEARNLRRASCLHALSRPEIDHLRALAPWTPICFIPNGVDLAFAEVLPPRSALEAEHPELCGKFVLLFFARLHVKKGLDLLAEAMGRIAADHPDVHLLLAGIDDGAWSPFRERMDQLGLGARMTYLGHVAGERACRAWAAADAFVLPSYSEGFSMAVLEAMACRLPSLITTACHFPEAAEAEAAISVTPDVDSVTRGLRVMLERSPAQRKELGLNGRRLVEESYTWDRQADRLASVYRWLSGGGPAPDVVIP